MVDASINSTTYVLFGFHETIFDTPHTSYGPDITGGNGGGGGGGGGGGLGRRMAALEAAMTKKSNSEKCPPQKQAFFDALGPTFKDMAQKANTDPYFIAALSAWESALLGQHAQDDHNPFGLTNAGKRNLKFDSYSDAADYWLYHAGRNGQGYADVVSGTTTIESFLAAAQSAGYNSADPNWASRIANLYRTSILPFRRRCGF